MHSSGPLSSGSCVSCENKEQGGKVDLKWMKADVDHQRREVGAWTKAKNFVSCVAFCFQYQMLLIFCRPHTEVSRDLKVAGQTQPQQGCQDSFTTVVRTNGETFRAASKSC